VVQLGLRIMQFTAVHEEDGRTLWEASVKR
jgi:hypothetical protein